MDGSADFDLVAASLRADAQDLRVFAEALTTKLEQSFPGRCHVDRSGLLGRGNVRRITVELGGSQGGTAAGICNTGCNLLGLVAPVLTPFLSHAVIAQSGVTEQVGWQWGIALGGLICLLGGVLWLWIDPHER